jgi:hypothetical protein
VLLDKAATIAYAATLMLAAGIRVEVGSKRLGHARISVTYDMYTHIPTTSSSARRRTPSGGCWPTAANPDVGETLAKGLMPTLDANRPRPCLCRSGAVSRERRGRESNP